jgi:serine/threonine-protein kinase HipA
MRQAEIYYKDVLAGMLTETDDGEYVFQYAEEYRNSYPGQFITFSMPVTGKPYISSRLFPIFEGLIPEGWLLEIASKNWKLNPNEP